ncbi:MAG TPA: hypothetical protein VGQ65_19485 [Thermoanaerobaculia bacterium]|jgi:hypothetical protein|nr:hypothetical protein [Thermoanaerobaculia bacterium]
MSIALVKQSPQRFAISIAAIFFVTLVAYFWPSAVRQPQRFAVLELLVFVVVIGLVKRHGAFRLSPVRALTVGPSSPIQRHTKSDGDDYFLRFWIAPTQPTPDITAACERLFGRVTTAWDSPSERVAWILSVAYLDARTSHSDLTRYTTELTECVQLLFVDYAAEALRIRSTLNISGPKYEMLLLEDEPIVGALVEDAFQEYGVLVKRLPLPPDVETEVRLTSPMLSDYRDTMATCFSIRFFADNTKWPVFPLACLKQPAVLGQLLPTRIDGVSSRYMMTLQRYVSAILNIGRALRASEPRRQE